MISTLSRLLLLSCFCLLFVACGGDAAEAETAETPTPEVVNVDPSQMIKSQGCGFLEDAAILEIVGAPNGIISGQTGPYVSSCVYRLESEDWVGNLLIEVGDGSRGAGIALVVSEAPPEEQLTVNGHDARMKNDNRWLEVAAAPPYVIKFSALPRKDKEEVIKSEDRLRILKELAAALEDAI